MVPIAPQKFKACLIVLVPGSAIRLEVRPRTGGEIQINIELCRTIGSLADWRRRWEVDAVFDMALFVGYQFPEGRLQRCHDQETCVYSLYYSAT